MSNLLDSISISADVYDAGGLMARNYPFGTNRNNGEKVGTSTRRSASLGTHQSRTRVTVLWLLFLQLHNLKALFAASEDFLRCTPSAEQFYSAHSRTAIEQGASTISLPAKCSSSIRTLTDSSFVSPGDELTSRESVALASCARPAASTLMRLA